ncbi:helix-turn-helix domain-containing protein [Cellulomonas marina]|uniref:Cupin domain-containing protein n=1 Tax=Cellulomonas marina TaxID=988821 RepID=A0A1I0Z6Q5_9CELL|nr:helix-turn-helix transcriptional regulator [Cellulomonas marina]GIG28228.1 transcriptional regulator [Cellulomonas marina]SFB20260.1 Cupin domain-containing protein [Cellulomonas marina]
MKQDELGTEDLIRQRLRSLRVSRGLSLDALGARCHLTPSTISRIETGHRRLAFDQLVPLARALGTSIDALVEPAGDDDVVIRPEPQHAAGLTTWLLSPERALPGITVAKMRIGTDRPREPAERRVHPGREWFLVLSGTVRLELGDRVLLVRAGEAASFSTMVPHAVLAHEGTVEVLSIFDVDGERTHLHEG